MLNQETKDLLKKTRAILAFHEKMGIAAIPRTGGIEKFLSAPPLPPLTPRPDAPSITRKAPGAAKSGMLYEPAPASALNQSLAEIYRDMEGCDRCPLHQNRQRLVGGCGPAKADLFIIEDRPTAAEEETGLPFAGAAGELLDKMLKAIDLDRSEVYLTSLVKCRPANDKDPGRDVIRPCLNFLARQIAAVNPVIICSMGPLAARILTGSSQSLFRFRGKIHDFHGTPLIPSFHPRFLLKNTEMKKGSWADLQAIRKKIG